MKTFIICLVFSFALPLSAQDSVAIKFQIITKKVKPNQNIFISGNHQKLGNWHPGLVSLTKLNDSTWENSFSFLEGDQLEFKFTKGKWDNEALNPDGTVPSNHFIKLIKDSTLTFIIKEWKDETNLIIKGQITGKVEYIRGLTYPELETRDAIIWLPPSYDSVQTKTYPVLYMHDGQNIIDPLTSSFQVDWQIDETADSLIKEDEIGEIIIVGIYNTINRYAEYSPNDTGYLYMRFIVELLKPLIDKNYRTKPEREYTATAGSSMGGLISLMLAWEHSETFSMAACLSPAFLYRNFNYVNTIAEYDGDKKSIKLYIDNGGVALENVLQPGIDMMLEVLIEKGFIQGEDLIWYKDEDSIHSESAWAKRSWRFLKMFFEKK